MRAKYEDIIEGHYSREWGQPVRKLKWEKGPFWELPVNFNVMVMSHPAPATAYATQCMSQPEDEARLELFLLMKDDKDIDLGLVELLTCVAHFHRTGHALGLGHTVNFGRPWIKGSKCSYGFISLPYLDPPSVAWLADPGIEFAWLIPVTKAEVDFKKTHGVEALEKRFEEKKFQYLDPFRASVV